MSSTPQHGIFALGTRSHHHLQLDVSAGAADDALLDALRSIRERTTTVQGVNLVVGLGPDLCRRLLPDALPDDMEPFQTVTSSGDDPVVRMPADQHDLWLWFHSGGIDAVFDAVREAAGALEGLAEMASEQPSFTYQASRDLTGFEDGTENPPLDEATDAAVVPDGSPGAGSSVVLVQRWVHDLAGFDQLDHDEQCQVFGRDKDTSEELPDDIRSPRAHISRVVIEDDEGEELEVFRRSTTFGGVLEHGLMFVAFSADRARLARMLDRMAGVGDEVTDRLTDFSHSTGGAWYVVPPIEAFAET
ncbi:MAG TPA: Dyp-type peroxidase [Acidimicrobiales bacterium]|nr:Dyp-type peroxidase [Acidimicrobiales bacterium]